MCAYCFRRLWLEEKLLSFALMWSIELRVVVIGGGCNAMSVYISYEIICSLVVLRHNCKLSADIKNVSYNHHQFVHNNFVSNMFFNE